MRTVKEVGERRNEILDVADALFGEKGFDKTSTNDILSKVGIARGTLYYHFKSKEDIMDALVERYRVELLAAAKECAGDKSIPVCERLVNTIKALNIEGKSGKRIKEHMHKEQVQNAVMHQKTNKIVVEQVPGILCEIIEDGITEGIFHTPFPYETVEMVVVYSNTVFDGLMSDSTSKADVLKKVEAFAFNIERLLEAESGSLKKCIFRMF